MIYIPSGLNTCDGAGIVNFKLCITLIDGSTCNYQIFYIAKKKKKKKNGVSEPPFGRESMIFYIKNNGLVI